MFIKILLAILFTFRWDQDWIELDKIIMVNLGRECIQPTRIRHILFMAPLDTISCEKLLYFIS